MVLAEFDFMGHPDIRLSGIQVLVCSGRAPRGRNYFGNSTGSSENETSQDIGERSLVLWHGLAAQV